MTCIMYISHLWIFFGVLVSSHALDRWTTRCTEVTIRASLKSEVFLPCNFNISFGNETVKWSNSSNAAPLLRIMNNGSIYFGSPTEGRVSVFPFLFRYGNFSIFIHDLEPSDLGPYFCELGSECRRVEITESEPEPDERRPDEVNPWFYFAAGAGLFILLFIAFSLISKFCGKHTNRSSKSNVTGVQSEGDIYPEETQNTERSEQRNNRGLRRGFTTIYENDVPANQSSSVQQGQHPQRAFRALPEPTASHPSDVKPYYVNQAELSIPGKTGKKRKKQKHFQFKNPIYGDCIE